MRLAIGDWKRGHLGTATVAQTGPDASGCRGLAIDWQSAHLPNTIRRNPDASRCIGTSLRYEPASNRIGGSAKMRPSAAIFGSLQDALQIPRSPDGQSFFSRYVSF